MKNDTFLFSFLLIWISFVLVQNVESATLPADSLPLIPYPQHIVVLHSDFRPTAKTCVRVCSSEKEDYFSATQLTEEFSKLYALNLKIDKAKTVIKNSILLTRPGLNKDADSRLKEAGLTVQSDFNVEGYVILADNLGIIVSANSAIGIYYGVQTLRQLIYPENGSCVVHGLQVRDWPALRYRWQQDDWNRGPIPTLEYAKKQVKIISEYKMNGYCIYSENIFESKKHPAINSYGATVTAAEMAELISYAKQFHVEIIPQQQTFGHLHYVLRQERYSHLGEKHGSQILSPMEQESYSFIGDYLSEIAPMFNSQFFHIGCDETFELGRGKSKAIVDSTSQADVYLSHLNRVASLPTLSGKKLLFWGEMAVKNPEKLSLLPKNVIAVAWDYLPRGNYDKLLKPYADKKIPTIVAPAAFYGGRVFPDYSSHLCNIREFVRDGQRFGSLGMLDCSWDDMGEDLFDMGWYGVVYAAACSWQSGESNEQQYCKAFDWAFYRNDSGNQIAKGINELASIHQRSGMVNFEMVYRSPFSKIGVPQQNNLTSLQNTPEMRLLAEDAYTLFFQQRSNAKLHAETIDALLFAARRMDFVFHKAIIAREMSKLYDAFVRDDDKGYEVNTALYDLIMPYASRMGDLRDMTKELKAFHQTLWEKENRPFHWGVIEARYMRMLMDWEDEYDLIQNDLMRFGVTGKHLPREEVGFIFDDK